MHGAGKKESPTPFGSNSGYAIKPKKAVKRQADTKAR